MPDLIVTAAQLVALEPVLVALSQMTPPPSPKGRYVLAKASAAVALATPAIHKRVFDLIAEMSDSQTPGDDGQVTFSIPADKQPAYHAKLAELESDTVTLAGVRPITQDELGACEVTIEMTRILILAGLLEDIEPM